MVGQSGTITAAKEPTFGRESGVGVSPYTSNIHAQIGYHNRMQLESDAKKRESDATKINYLTDEFSKMRMNGTGGRKMRKSKNKRRSNKRRSNKRRKSSKK